MRTKILLIALIVIAVMLQGCGKQSSDSILPDTSSVQKTDSDVSEPAEAPADPSPSAEEPATEEAPEPEAAEVPLTESSNELPGNVEEAYVEEVVLDIEQPEQEAEIMAAPPEPAVPTILEPVASGELVSDNGRVIIDYSNTEDGYIMINFTGQTATRLKVQITGSSTTYTYNLPQGEWTVFPLSDGNAYYQFKVFENISGSSYSLVAAAGAEVQLADEFAPFLRPNQFVNYSAASTAVAKAAELTQGIEAPLEKVAAIYSYVVSELTYDNYKAQTVQSGYIPVLDTIMVEKTGICFDYAALMTGMLRSQGIPCKMVFGYASGAYHAWISVWTDETGWVDGMIFFDGIAWHRLDPTFASSAGQSDAIMQYIGNGTNYSEKYFY